MDLLYLFRHGIAEAVGPDGNDASRRLTDEGVERTTGAARGLAKIVGSVDAILTSPLVRAVQTAAILGEVIDVEPEVMPLLGEYRPRDIAAELFARDETDVAIVGHEPTFSRLVEMLCTEDEASDFIRLKKAGAACLDVSCADSDGGAAELLWLATPKMLRALGAP